MKFLIDAQLPPVLPRVMEREGFDAVHTKDLDLAPSEDHEIRDYALANDYVVISKDDDFTAYASEPHNLKVIWVRTGNCKNKLLIECPRIANKAGFGREKQVLLHLKGRHLKRRP